MVYHRGSGAGRGVLSRWSISPKRGAEFGSLKSRVGLSRIRPAGYIRQGKRMSKHNLKHHRFGVITICGIFIAGPNGKEILAEYFEDVTCRRCLSGLENARKCIGLFAELPTRKKRADERAAHLRLKAKAEAGMSWQEARDLMRGMRRGFTPRGGCLDERDKAI